MRASRIVVLLIGLAIVLYLVKNQATLFKPGSGDAEKGSPIDRARAVRDKADAKAAETESATHEAEANAPPAAGVTENMTPDQVRALLGPPDDIENGIADNGKPQETWNYRRVGKTVVFENGVAVAIR